MEVKEPPAGADPAAPAGGVAAEPTTVTLGRLPVTAMRGVAFANTGKHDEAAAEITALDEAVAALAD